MHSNHVCRLRLRAVLQRGVVQPNRKSGVAAAVCHQKLAVEIDFGELIRTFEVEIDCLPFEVLRERERLAIPGCIPGLRNKTLPFFNIFPISGKLSPGSCLVNFQFSRWRKNSEKRAAFSVLDKLCSRRFHLNH